jgi:hypothetical protein
LPFIEYIVEIMPHLARTPRGSCASIPTQTRRLASAACLSSWLPILARCARSPHACNWSLTCSTTIARRSI